MTRTLVLSVVCLSCGVPRGALTSQDGGVGDGGIDDSGFDACVASAEDCNGVDDDCDGSIDEMLTTRSCGLSGVCMDGVETCSGGAWSPCSILPGDEDCTAALDEDCDGAVDEECACSGGPRACGDTDVGACEFGTQTCDGETWSPCMGAVTPTGETCNDLDDDCDGMTDEMVRTIYFRDADGDGFGTPSMMIEACALPDGFVSNSMDCDDTTDTRRPGIEESCNSVDDDCDSNTDEDAGGFYYQDLDGDGFGDPGTEVQACEQPPGTITDSMDCDDDCFFCQPRMPSELCDGDDNDCDTAIDEGCACEPLELPVGRYIACPEIPRDWDSARVTCNTFMMDLAVLDSDAENDAVIEGLRAIRTDFTWWIGASDRADEEEWFWVNGTQFTDCSGFGPCDCVSGDCNWANDEPNNSGNEDCGSLRPNGEWNDVRCSDILSFVCE